MDYKAEPESIGTVKCRLVTTHRDAFGTKLSYNALVSILEDIQKNPLINIHHSHATKPIGIVRNQRLMKLEDGEFAIEAEVDVFDSEAFSMIKKGELKGLSYEGIESESVKKPISMNFDDRFFSESDIVEIENQFENSELNHISTNRYIIRGIDGHIFIGLVVLGGLIFGRRFIEKVSEELGEEVGQDLRNVYKKCKSIIINKLKEKDKKIGLQLSVRVADIKPSITMTYEGVDIHDVERMLDNINQVEDLIDKSQFPIGMDDIIQIKLKWERGSWHLISLETRVKVFEYKNGGWAKFI